MINWPATIVLSLVAFSIRLLIRQSRAKRMAQLEAPRDYRNEEQASHKARRRMRPDVLDALPTGNTGQLVQVTGTVAATIDAPPPLVSPLSGTPCVAYAIRATVWESKKADHVVGEVREAKAAAFVLSVGAHELAVPADLEIAMKGADAKPTLERAQAFLAPRQMADYAAWTDFTEVVLVPGDVVSVVGQVIHENAETGYREGATRARLIAHVSGPMQIVPPPRTKR